MYHQVCVKWERAEAIINRPTMRARINPPLENLTHRTKRRIERKLKKKGGGWRKSAFRLTRPRHRLPKTLFYFSLPPPSIPSSSSSSGRDWQSRTKLVIMASHTSLRSLLPLVPSSFPSLILSSSRPRINNETLGRDGESAPSCLPWFFFLSSLPPPCLLLFDFLLFL